MELAHLSPPLRASLLSPTPKNPNPRLLAGSPLSGPCLWQVIKLTFLLSLVKVPLSHAMAWRRGPALEMAVLLAYLSLVSFNLESPPLGRSARVGVRCKSRNRQMNSNLPKPQMSLETHVFLLSWKEEMSMRVDLGQQVEVIGISP